MTAPTQLDPLASVDDFAAWPGVDVDDTERVTAQAVLDAASAYIRLESGSVGRWPTGDTVPAAVRALCVQVAARVWRNPDNATMLTTGPFSEAFSQGVEDALYLSDNDRRTIRASVSRPGLWTLSTQRDDCCSDGVLVPCDGFADPMLLDSWGNVGDAP